MQAPTSTPSDLREPRSLAQGASGPATVGTIAALAITILWTSDRPSGPNPFRAVLHASPATSPGANDSDGDGLADALEVLNGLAPDKPDTDRDGYSDSEEIARHSSALDAGSIPVPGETLSLNVLVYQDNGPVRPVSVMYAADGDFNSKQIAMGARVGKSVRSVPVGFFTMNGTIKVVTGQKQGSSVMVIDGAVDPEHVYRFGSLSFYTTLAHGGPPLVAAVVNVADKDGVIVEYKVSGVAPLAQRGQSSAGTGTASYSPIDSEVPSEWIPGQICAQTTAVAATLGPVIVQEVLQAGCEDGWDTFCDPNCSATAGTTIQTVDPAALIGG